MKAPQAPRIDQRRKAQFSAELQERARTWIPGWAFADVEGDFGRALLEIAARFDSEVTEQLDGAGEKMRRGFLDWLAVRGEAARPARTPVVFKLADAAKQAVLASAPVRLQADAAGTPVVFETEKDVRVVPGRLDVVVGVDAANDAFYLPPPGLSDLKPLEPLPTQWQLKTFAAAGATKLQLDPEAGLVVDMIVEAGGRQYRITNVDNGIVTIDPRLDAELQENTVVKKVVTFAPFDGIARNRQEHALYLGHMDLLKIEAKATIDVVGAASLATGIKWQYWGKVEGSEEADWQELKLAAPDKQKSDALVLEKPKKGAVEPKEIGDINSRWIRAYSTKVDGSDPLLRVDALQIRINCAKKFPDCPNAGSTHVPSPVAEAMANTTPLVLDKLFFPLGKEPRQFDAFYLGSGEAFSKQSAVVQLCFEMADRTFSSLVAVREGSFENRVLAGVAKDRSLHLLSFDPTTGSIGKFRDHEPLQPPRPGYLGVTEEGNAVALDIQPPWRCPVWSQFDFGPFAGFLVGASAGDSICVWREDSLVAKNSGWINFGQLPPGPTTPSTPIDGLVYLAGATPVLAALREGKLFIRVWPPNSATQWNPVDTKDGMNNTIGLKSIVPVFVPDTSKRLLTSQVAGMIGIDDNKKLFHVAMSGVCTPLLQTFDFNAAIRPVAIEISGDRHVAAVTASDPPDLVARRQTGAPEQITLDSGTAVLAALDAAVIDGTFQVLATVRDGVGGRLTTWAPFETGAAASVFASSLGTSGGLAVGAPTIVGKYVVIPGARADILFSEFDPTLRLFKSADVETGIVVPETVPALAVPDLIVRLDSSVEPVSRAIKLAGPTKEGEVFYSIAAAFPSNTTSLNAYHLSDVLSGTFVNPDLTLDSTDQETAEGDWLWIDHEFYEVLSIAAVAGDRIATLDIPNPNGTTPPNGNYVRPIETGGRVAPFMHLDTSVNGNGDWNADLLKRIPLIFPGKTPREQRGKAFKLTVDNKPIYVVLGAEFQGAITNPVNFLVDAAFGEWRRDMGDRSTNPELSWEYWNGKGWWSLNVTHDETENLKTTGALQFDVPTDIASSDWAGKTNLWIRARLIGGDYGKEKVTVTTKPLPSPPNPAGSTEQTVDRSTEGIRPPSVLKLEISYRVCDPVLPAFVLAQDSGSILNQSDANRTGGAIVEAFVPLSLMLGRLSGNVAAAEPTQKCPPQYECQKHTSSSANAPAAPAPVPATPATPQTGRSLFIGLDATVSEAPVNVLLLVDAEHDHTSLAPMTIEALATGHFKPIVADDATRALGESGVLSMSFAVPPTLSDLFGRTRTWLRLIPKAAQDEWTPSLRGAYLNAVFAGATETLTRELVGSSAGSPNLTLRLARPPVLRDTLELRVREPLGEEERDALLNIDSKLVLHDEALPGDWVLWKKVIDPDDEGPSERVYALDETNGEIRFGNGIHGRIPPIGRDSIVAFRYCRTEVGTGASSTVPGNLITARTPLNLVSPVESVEAVFAADQAAGGAPPESDERVLRFGFARLRHRGRAVTANDIEDLALESSPDIAQVRALVKRGYIRLVVVMKGKNPTPNAAQARELRRLLLESAPISLSAPNALRIEGPGVRKLRIALMLEIATLDYAGQMSKWVKDHLATFFDSTNGGIDKDGWALGLNPTDEDVAFVLINAPHLDGIADVGLFESVGDGIERPWPETIKPTDIVMLDDDPVRIQFKTAEVMA